MSSASIDRPPLKQNKPLPCNRTITSWARLRKRAIETLQTIARNSGSERSTIRIEAFCLEKCLTPSMLFIPCSTAFRTVSSISNIFSFCCIFRWCSSPQSIDSEKLRCLLYRPTVNYHASVAVVVFCVLGSRDWYVIVRGTVTSLLITTTGCQREPVIVLILTGR